jgi:DNA-binding transcriptional regulator YhcF (GntR family)
VKQGYTKSWRKKYAGKTASRGLLYVGAMDWLVGNANFVSSWDNGEKCGRGQLYIGRADLARIWKVGEQTVRTILKNLEKDGFLTSQSTNRGTIITITNYDTYQAEEERHQPANQPATNQQKTKVVGKSTSRLTNRNDGLNTSQTTTNAMPENGSQPANQPATNQRPPENQPLNKNNNIYISKGDDFGEAGKNHWGVAPPTEPEAVKAEALRIGYDMSDERAQEFLAHYQSLGWRLNGGYIHDWRKLLMRWKVTENRKGNRHDAGRSNSSGRKEIADQSAFEGIATTKI